MQALLPSNETERLRALIGCDILDTDPEMAFDRITALASRIFRVPICLVSLVDADRQWFKSCRGLDFRQTERSVAFCAHAILEGGVMVIEDAALDERFASSPLVAGSTGVRFYAGAPLRNAAGFALGTLCLMDRRPREFSEEDRATLTDLAAMVVDELDLRTTKKHLESELAERKFAQEALRQSSASLETRIDERVRELQLANSALRKAEESYQALFLNAVDGIFQSTTGGRYLDVNPALARIYGFESPSELISSITDIEHELYVHPEVRREFVRRMTIEDAVTAFEAEVYRQDGSVIWISETARAVRNHGGDIQYFEGFVTDITARRIAEHALHKMNADLELRVLERTVELERSNAELRAASQQNNFLVAAVRSSDTGMVVTDPNQPDNPTIFVNPAFERITGYSAAESIGRNCRFLQGWGTDPEVAQEMRTAIKEGRPFRGLLLNFRKDATPFWNAVTINPVFDTEGRLLHFVGLQIDVTDRIAAQDALRESQARLQAIMDNTTSVIFVKDLQGRFLLMNQRYEQICKISRGSMIGRTVFDIHPPEQAREYHEHDQLVLSADAPQEFEECAIHDGVLHTYFTVKFPLRDSNGIVTGLCGISTDITKRKQAEQALFQSQARKAAILEASLDAIITIDHRGYVLEINSATERIFGYTAEQMVGHDMTDLIVPPTMREMHREGMQRFLATGEGPVLGKRLEMPAMRADGDTFPVELTITRIAMDGLPMFTGHLRDITARRQNELKLQEAKEEAERANAAKSEFLSRMSHELRTPLNAILGFGQLLQRRSLDDRQAESVNFIVKAGRHLLDLINEVLDLTRIEAGRTTISLEAVKLLDVLEESVNLVQTTSQTQGVAIVLRIPDIENRLVTADRQRLKQVFVNLLSNAVKYNIPGGRATLGCEKRGSNALRIWLSDTGRGMNREQIARLFVPFDRLGMENEGIDGHGIGLSLSKQLMTLMHGTIEVESDPGQGSTFSVILPEAISQPLGGTAAAAGANGSELGFTERKTVLYVEDNSINLTLMQWLTRDHPGVRLISATRGVDVLRMAQETRPALILLDLHLPDLPGDQVLRLIRGDKSLGATPVVIVSADAMTRQIKRMMDLGADEYITKPIDPDKLLQVFERFLKPSS